jgi:hypothetical protein
MNEGERIEGLMTELRGTTAAHTWERIDELVHALVTMYGEGLRRIVARLDAGMCATLADDDLVASLLALHGMHPVPPEQRIAEALAAAAPQLGTVTLLGISEGVARLALGGGKGAPPAVTAALLDELVRQAAPEIERIVLEDATPPSLVQIDLARSRR